MGSLPCVSNSPAVKIRMSPESSQPEGASLESCYSVSSAHGPARREAQRLGILACPNTSNFKRSPGIGGPCLAPSAALLRKCEILQTAGSQKGLDWKTCSASSAHGSARKVAERLGLLACLAISNFKRILGMGYIPVGCLQ